MNTDKNLNNILTKIVETQLAILHCHTNNLLKIPNHIITTRKVDEDGNIWFYVRRPLQSINQFELEFPVGLNYYKKGSSYSIKIFGKGRIVIDPEELNTLEGFTAEEVNHAIYDQVLLKVKILRADVTENNYDPNNNFSRRIRAAFYSLFDWLKPNVPSFDYNSNSTLSYSY